LIAGNEKNMNNNEHTQDIEVESAPKEKTDYTLFLIIGVVALVLILAVALYIWKFRPTISPPPGSEEEPQPDEGPQIEAVEPEKEEEDMGEEPVLEMHLEPPEEPVPPDEDMVEEEVIVAEIVEVEDISVEAAVPPEPVPPQPLIEEDDEGMIPEV
jgi:hypothetical protein